MRLKAFLSSKAARHAVAGSALAMTVPALSGLAARADSLFIHGPGFGGIGLRGVSAILLPMAVGALGYAWGRAEDRLKNASAAMAAREAGLIHEARHDALTGLRNRFALKQDVAAILAERTLPQQAMLILDLDRFKFVNDTLGHDSGDELLIAFARRLKSLRQPQDQLYRLGGDEFIFLLSNPDDHGGADAFCRKVEAEAERPYDLAKGRVATGISIGVTFLRSGDPDLSACLKRADLALYKAKDIAGSSHAFFTDGLAEESLLRIELERDLSKALADDEFFLEYQPIVGVESGAIRSFEALIRWNHPQRGVLPPQMFVPLAERTGLIVPLGRWVMRQACIEAAKWPSPVGVAVNVAGDQFKDRTFLDYVQACLKEARLAPGRLTIEVTESLFTINIDCLAESLAFLRTLGVRIALDDFGTGFSSISNLKTFPLDQLKIDRSFAHAMLRDQRDGDLVDLITRLGDTFRVATTIEGIETESQLEFVRGLGVAEAQGFLIAKPMPADQVQGFFEGRQKPPAPLRGIDQEPQQQQQKIP